MRKGKKKKLIPQEFHVQQDFIMHKNCKIFQLEALVISAKKATKLDAFH
jgi:hypothetical protein